MVNNDEDVSSLQGTFFIISGRGRRQISPHWVNAARMGFPRSIVFDVDGSHQPKMSLSAPIDTDISQWALALNKSQTFVNYGISLSKTGPENPEKCND